MKLLFRILGGVFVALVAVVLALLASIPIDGFLNRAKVMTMTNTVVPASAQEVNAFVASPEGSEKLPAIIMIHEFWGLKPEIVGKAEALSGEGYIVVAPDTFRGQTTSWLPKAIWQTLRTPKENITADLDAVFAWLKAQPNVDSTRIMIMGFCYGGGTSLLYSLHNPELAATGVFYGNVGVEADFSVLPGPVLGIFGEDDASIPLEEVQTFEARLEEASIPKQISIYPDKGHAFVKSMDEIARDPVQQQAWQEFLEFADTHLKRGL
ncbi:MAG: dienelactone hydrolase family protein [Trueperaceae bacterium]